MSNITSVSQMSETELMQVLQSSLYPGAAEQSIKMVIGYCRAAGLDPMQKPVHIVPMWDSKSGSMRDVIMPGVGLYRTQAARAGCAGVSEPDFGPDVTENIGGVEITYPAWCRVTAKRKLQSGEIVEFTAKEFWKENYAVRGGKEKSIAPNAMWSKRPYGQIAKCAEAQALRKAFPEVGSEATADEMIGKVINEYDMGVAEVIPARQAAPAALPAYSDDQFSTNLPAWIEAMHAGKITPEQVIARVSSKATLSQNQIEAIRLAAVKPEAEEQPDDDFVTAYEGAQE